MRHSCIALDVVDELLKKLDTCLSHRCRDLLARGDYAGYIGLSVDPSTYSDWNMFYRDYISISLLSKWQHFNLGVDRAAVAMDKFLLSEKLCAETNNRVRFFDRGLAKANPDAYWVLNLARRKIETVLGPFDWNDAHNHMGFGPGATLDLRRAHGNAQYKFGCKKPSVTRDSSVLAACVISQVPSWSSTISTDTSVTGIVDNLNIVHGNAVTTVPKNAKTDRVIAKEPTMNMFLQRGIGGVMRRKLKRVGINLDDQTRNQRLAREGSETGTLATIDLSAASDSVALALVEWLLPEDWVRAIKLTRSPAGELPDGSRIRYEKVSSMGNGFTFELESLIFYALTYAVMDRRGMGHAPCAVYGDDIICPTVCAQELIDVLSLCGFTTNTDKTYVDGPFRESCGKHYFNGRDVTPIYVKERVSTLERKFWFANSISLLAYRIRGLGWSRCAELKSAFSYVLDHVPERSRAPSVAWNFSNGGIAGDFDEVCPTYDRTTRTFLVRHRARVITTRDAWGLPALSQSIWRISTRKDWDCHNRGALFRLQRGVDVGPTDHGVTAVPTDRTHWKYIKTPVERWEGLGPWL